MKRPWMVFQSTWSNTPRSSAVEWNAQCLTRESEPNTRTYTSAIANAIRPSCRSSHVQKLAGAVSGEFLTAVGRGTALFSRPDARRLGGLSLVSPAAAARAKPAIHHCEEQLHVNDDQYAPEALVS